MKLMANCTAISSQGKMSVCCNNLAFIVINIHLSSRGLALISVKKDENMKIWQKKDDARNSHCLKHVHIGKLCGELEKDY